MQHVTTLSLASLLMLSSFTAFAAGVEGAAVNGWQHDDDSAMKRIPGQQGMFDGVKLTEQQRQQMRDLMHQGRQDAPAFNTEDIETMHKLVIANRFDEAAVRAQITKMMQGQIERQVQMTRVRNQMYNLLTTEQKNILDQKHQQRMKEMQQQISIFNRMPDQ
ncbi:MULTISPECIES: cell-envelope stress modulator CpxP [unclassified Brenneria]|uniref:cell-envelope stress modulator CpxP n=1 Tax=unclassified Brenneria TaxID=2634434 RepID=UPI00155599ED|nr:MULTISPECIES: cell-envelope stress modulator CpxP [unclassified Brenneria]MBJ7222129.1 cell-envelope stress modulator CpxP [Brenneria sp. L3-3C-1]MEE3643373.1 cell-envelope stress modulator CpxP [Brenneria sp. L3_3C_1]MEE3651558.1 cell-envelope stress modulator CpxP [Brenneria sp. HEZEL_4_2_4]NPD01514.1 periplasmic heavy metal sensor [Brenneria sp. hezel4-2-4]